MAAQDRATLKSAFEQGDRPQGSDFSDLIDSFVSLVDTTAQSVLSDLSVPNLTVGGTLIVASLTVQEMIASALTVLSPVSFVGAVSAPQMLCSQLFCSGTAVASVLDVTNTVQAFRVNVSNRVTWGSVQGCELSVNGTVNCVEMRYLDAALTAFTSAQTSAFFSDGIGNMGAIKFFKMVVNGSTYGIPMFKGTLFT